MTTQTKQDPIRELNECILNIYGIMDKLISIKIDNAILGLTFQNLRDATRDIQKGIGTLYDQLKDETKQTE